VQQFLIERTKKADFALHYLQMYG